MTETALRGPETADNDVPEVPDGPLALDIPSDAAGVGDITVEITVEPLAEPLASGDPTAGGFAALDGVRAPAHHEIPPDLATCADCLRELFDPAARRYRYPFVNCGVSHGQAAIAAVRLAER